jgi:hypothetical protein
MANSNILDDAEIMTVTNMIRLSLFRAWNDMQTNIGIVVPDHVQLIEIFQEMHDEEKTVPKWMKAHITRSGMSNGCIVFDNESMIKLMYNPMHSKGRSFYALFIHRDCVTDKELMCSVIPCLSSQNNLRYFK